MKCCDSLICSCFSCNRISPFFLPMSVLWLLLCSFTCRLLLAQGHKIQCCKSVTTGLLFPPPFPSCCYWCSGLDARSAAVVMRAVRNTVNTGRTVVCTIHQPSIDIFDVRLGDRGWQGVLGRTGGFWLWDGRLGQGVVWCGVHHPSTVNMTCLMM